MITDNLNIAIVHLNNIDILIHKINYGISKNAVFDLKSAGFKDDGLKKANRELPTEAFATFFGFFGYDFFNGKNKCTGSDH